MTQWNQSNLRTHYQKHPDGSCSACWASLLDKTPSISIEEYRQESLAHVPKAAFSFSALYKKTNQEPAIWRQYFVNEKLILTVVDGLSDEVTTSYRWHRNHQDHSTDCSLSTWLRMIERFSDKRAAIEGKMTGFRNIKAIVRHLSPNERDVIKAATKKLTNPLSKKR
jgi:hypothetical protein